MWCSAMGTLSQTLCRWPETGRRCWEGDVGKVTRGRATRVATVTGRRGAKKDGWMVRHEEVEEMGARQQAAGWKEPFLIEAEGQQLKTSLSGRTCVVFCGQRECRWAESKVRSESKGVTRRVRTMGVVNWGAPWLASGWAAVTRPLPHMPVAPGADTLQV